MKRWILPVVLFTLLSAHPASSRPAIDMPGAALILQPPDGDDWRVDAKTSAPGQWYSVFARNDTVLGALVVPFNASTPTDPVKLLHTAVQSLKNTAWRLGIQSALGMPEIGPLTLMGHQGAEGRIDTRRNGRRYAGHARVLLTGAHWGFTWGLFPLGAPGTERDAVRAFVHSMIPKSPAFFTPRFADPDRADEILARPTGEKPILRKHVIALERIIQMALGGPMCLSRRVQLRQVLLIDATSGPQRLRDGMRETPAVFERHPDLTEPAQRERQRALGEAVHHGYLSRYLRQDPNAINFKHLWDASQRVLAGKPPGEILRARDIDNLMEMLAFWAGLAADGPREVSVAQAEAFRAARVKAWPTASPALRAAWLSAGRDWMRLRYAWDQANAGTRNALRRAILEALATPEQRKSLDAATGPRALKTWIDANGPPDIERVLDVGAAMTQPVRDAILHNLVPWPSTVPLGW